MANPSELARIDEEANVHHDNPMAGRNQPDTLTVNEAKYLADLTAGVCEPNSTVVIHELH